MTRSNQKRLGITAMIAASVLVLAAAGQAAMQSPARAAECSVADIDEDRVTVRDVEQVRALIQPPPTREEAERLAIAATIAYRAQNPSAALAGMPARLAAYRQALRNRINLDAAPVKKGPCANAKMNRE